MKILNLPDVLQRGDYNCGVYATQVMMAYYGEDWSDKELEKELNTDKEWGTDTKEIVNFFKKEGFKVFEGEFTLDKLRSAINQDIPVIMLIQAWAEGTTNYKTTQEWGHYVVCVGYNNKGFFFEDPAIFGRAFLSTQDLEARWHGLDKVVLNKYGIAVWGKGIWDMDKPIKIEHKYLYQNGMMMEQLQKPYERLEISDVSSGGVRITLIKGGHDTTLRERDGKWNWDTPEAATKYARKHHPNLNIYYNGKLFKKGKGVISGTKERRIRKGWDIINKFLKIIVERAKAGANISDAFNHQKFEIVPDLHEALRNFKTAKEFRLRFYANGYSADVVAYLDGDKKRQVWIEGAGHLLNGKHSEEIKRMSQFAKILPGKLKGSEKKSYNLIQKIADDLKSFDPGGEEGEIQKSKNAVSKDFRHLGKWLHDEESGRDHEEDGDYGWREDDDQMIWAPGEGKKYMKVFADWVKNREWRRKVTLHLSTSEKNWCEFEVRLKLKNNLKESLQEQKKIFTLSDVKNIISKKIEKLKVDAKKLASDKKLSSLMNDFADEHQNILELIKQKKYKEALKFYDRKKMGASVQGQLPNRVLLFLDKQVS